MSYGALMDSSYIAVDADAASAQVGKHGGHAEHKQSLYQHTIEEVTHCDAAAVIPHEDAATTCWDQDPN